MARVAIVIDQSGQSGSGARNLSEDVEVQSLEIEPAATLPLVAALRGFLAVQGKNC